MLQGYGRLVVVLGAVKRSLFTIVLCLQRAASGARDLRSFAVVRAYIYDSRPSLGGARAVTLVLCIGT